jgi:voltage-gated potassium channel
MAAAGLSSLSHSLKSMAEAKPQSLKIAVGPLKKVRATTSRKTKTRRKLLEAKKMKEHAKELAYRSFLFMGLSIIFVVGPWQVAFQNDFGVSAVYFDLLSTSLLLMGEFLRKGKKTFTSWAKTLLLAFPFASLLKPLVMTRPLVHAFWLIKSPRAIKELSDTKFLDTFPSLKRHYGLVITIALIGLFIHFFACIWITLTGNEGDPTTVYIKAVYWTVTTIATVGYGDITPTTNASRIFAMAVMFFGVGFYGFIVSRISTFLFQKDRRSEAHNEKMEHLTAFLHHYKIPGQLRGEVFSFYEHRLLAKMNDEEEEILTELPSGLKHEIQTYLNVAPLSRTQIFKGCSEACLKDAAVALERKVVSPKEMIIQRGDVGKEMYIIAHGSVRVLVDTQTVATLSKGQSFGETALIKEEPRSADVESISYGDLYVLTKEHFEKLMLNHEDLRENVIKSQKNKE